MPLVTRLAMPVTRPQCRDPRRTEHACCDLAELCTSRNQDISVVCSSVQRQERQTGSSGHIPGNPSSQLDLISCCAAPRHIDMQSFGRTRLSQIVRAASVPPAASQQRRGRTSFRKPFLMACKAAKQETADFDPLVDERLPVTVRDLWSVLRTCVSSLQSSAHWCCRPKCCRGPQLVTCIRPRDNKPPCWMIGN
jgi:hypothetical protein